MASFNKVILMGNLTRDPQVRYIPSGTAVADVGLAVNRQWFDKQTQQRKEEVSFIDVTLWARQAEVAGEYLSKGSPVLIEGYLRMETWQDKESGQNRSRLKVVCENLRMLGRAGEGAAGGGARRGAPAEEMGGGPEESFYDSPGPDAPDDDVPF